MCVLLAATLKQRWHSREGSSTLASSLVSLSAGLCPTLSEAGAVRRSGSAEWCQTPLESCSITAPVAHALLLLALWDVGELPLGHFPWATSLIR